MKNLVKKFQNISHQYDLWKKGDKIVVACSGGPDSTCLLDIFARLAPKYGLKLIVAHVNYGLRRKDSDRDENLVRKLARKLGIQIEVFPKTRLSSFLKPGFRKMPAENTLRDIRYTFFENVRRKSGFDYIAVGHTLDDQAETCLMRIIRGSGLAGLASMRHKNEKIIRPLLGITKKEILEYLKKNKLKYRIDNSNKEVFYLRNKIRNELIPILEKKYNPNIKKTLYQSSLTVAEDYDLIENLISLLYSRVNLNRKKILKFHLALQKRIILKMIENKKGSLKNISASHVNEVLKIVRSIKNKRQVVRFQGLKITRIGDRMEIVGSTLKKSKANLR